MRRLLLIVFIMSVSIIASPAFAQERVKESVEVKWWVIPLFAVGDKGESVMDLKEEDIKLLLDGSAVTDFILYRKTFSVSSEADRKQIVKKDPLKDKEKMIFFLFDTALSTNEAIERSRKIAMTIVDKADKNNRFVIMSIVPNSGLIYIVGPTNDKKIIQQSIEERVVARNNTRRSIAGEVLDGSAACRYSKYEGHIMPNLNEVTSFLLPHLTGSLKQNNVNFFRSFETLFYAVNTIKSNKFIYLFTEGIARNTQIGDKQSMYHLFLKKVADYLSQSGAVLFILNPSGVGTSGFSSYTSGEDSLRYLAKESGGKYFEGAEEKIASRIENIHRAYYEIGFSDLPDSKNNTLRVTLKSNRKGINIHTLRSVKESNNYSKMKKVEKEMLALNLISKNPLFKLSFPFKDITVDKIVDAGHKTVFHVVIPEDFLGHECDLFKIQVDSKSREPKITKQRVKPLNNKLKIEIENIKGKENHFVLIVEETNSALLGRFDYREDGKIGGFQTQADGSLKVSKISLKEVGFEASTLHLVIENFMLRKTPRGPEGKIDITVSIRNLQGIELFDEHKVLQPQKETVTIDLPLKWLKKGRYRIVIKIVDGLTGKTDKKSIRPRWDTP